MSILPDGLCNSPAREHVIAGRMNFAGLSFVPKIAAVIPCFRGYSTILGVIRDIGPEIDRIYVVDDGCPENTGELIKLECHDQRVVLLGNPRNLGVGGAMRTGYRRALSDGARIVVKIDADGQMDPAHIPYLLEPIRSGRAQYAKGNRFARAELMPPGSAANALADMPFTRRIGNAALSLLHKAATGYWAIADPTNGYTAISRGALERIALGSVADCYFFEIDMLFQLSLSGAQIEDVPLPARYAGEVSSLRVPRVLGRFSVLILMRLLQRLYRRGFPRNPPLYLAKKFR